MRPRTIQHVPQQNQAANDDFLFDQGPTKGLRKIRFHDYNIAYTSRDTRPTCNVFREQITAFKGMLLAAPPDEGQQKDIDFLLAGGEIFALVVYGQLISGERENLRHVADDMSSTRFSTSWCADFSRHALSLYSKPSSSDNANGVLSRR